MPVLFGRDLDSSELRRLVGTESQVAGIRLVELADGRARGIRAADVYTGSGFRFLVLIDRGLDVGPAEHAGRPLAWVHPALGSPALHERPGIGWLRTFGGGLVTTCGLTDYGAPDDEGPEGFGLHGRASHLPGENVRVRQEWRGEDYILEIEGETRESRSPSRGRRAPCRAAGRSPRRLLRLPGGGPGSSPRRPGRPRRRGSFASGTAVDRASSLSRARPPQRNHGSCPATEMWARPIPRGIAGGSAARLSGQSAFATAGVRTMFR